VKEEYCLIKRVFSRQGGEIFLDRGPFDLAFFRWHGSSVLLRRDAAGRDIPRNVVTFPVLQQKWGWRNVGKAIDREIAQETLLFVDLVPEAIACRRDEVSLAAARIVVSQDDEDVGIVHT